MPLLSVRDLRVHFKIGHAVAKAVDGVGFSIDRDRVLGLVGESGCGKTVTALSILGLLPRTTATLSGSILFNGTQLLGLDDSKLREIRGRDIGMIFQEPMTSLNPVLTVGDQIREVLKLHKNMNSRQARAFTVDLLSRLGLGEPETLLGAYPGQLSGGMRQRAMIAMATAASPALLIADEPTTALDVTVQAQVLALIKRLNQEKGVAVLLVTHDLGVVAEICDDVVVMYAGKIAEVAVVKRFFDTPLHPYSKGLLAAMRSLAKGNVSETIRGQVGPATDVPPGCRFHPRCPEVLDRCKFVEPGMSQQDGSSVACHLYSVT